MRKFNHEKEQYLQKNGLKIPKLSHTNMKIRLRGQAREVIEKRRKHPGFLVLLRRYLPIQQEI